jgi:two-component system sensor histidine kinase PilS (NtrC family)
MQSMFDERTWLAWLVKVRILILTFLLGIELILNRVAETPLPVKFFISIILFWFALALFYVLLLSVWDELRLQAALQVATDLVLVTLVVQATGSWDSSLNFLYPLVIIVASILLPRAWAYLSAALAFMLYGAILELTYYGAVRSYANTHPELLSLQAIILLNLSGFLAIAYLAGLLSNKLRQVDVQLKDASGALENLQALHENIIQAISAGLITTGLDGHVRFANAAAGRLLGLAEEALSGKPIGNFFLDALPQAGSERAHGEVRFQPVDGFRKTFRVIASPLVVKDRGTVGFVYTLEDLTEIRRLEREVRMQDRLAAVGRLAAAIAHEIRNPLTSIAGSASMLSSTTEVTDEQRQLLQIVTRESERLNNIITDFLAYSRGKQYRFDRVDLIPLIKDTLTLLENRLLAENAGIVIRQEFSMREAWTLADGDKIKQVFWNFSQNAVRAMKSGGQLTVSIEAIGEDWQVNFADTGQGMSPQQTEKIFEPFQSGFEGGTGLGLAIVYQIVQAHEGKVWARSRLGEGTTFVLRLRRMNDAVAAGDTVGGSASKALPAAIPHAAQVLAAEGRAHG